MLSSPSKELDVFKHDIALFVHADRKPQEAVGCAIEFTNLDNMTHASSGSFKCIVCHLLHGSFAGGLC